MPEQRDHSSICPPASCTHPQHHSTTAPQHHQIKRKIRPLYALCCCLALRQHNNHLSSSSTTATVINLHITRETDR
ncbi:hypothetical protein E2C01_054414 [Portunus trituberculatus]|uniref:Uncharacterized protein n=1 Tax=Portunus trituberculatus TaxID=210409 RepID=A0A5B7GJC6_PORTR|nr:hypothetical protein [Portunus trituberculatus]